MLIAVEAVTPAVIPISDKIVPVPTVMVNVKLLLSLEIIIAPFTLDLLAVTPVTPTVLISSTREFNVVPVAVKVVSLILKLCHYLIVKEHENEVAKLSNY